MQILVSNLNQRTLGTELRKLFAAFGEVETAELEKDHLNGRPRGTALVSMPVERQALLAIASLNQTMVNGRKINVSESRTIF